MSGDYGYTDRARLFSVLPSNSAPVKFARSKSAPERSAHTTDAPSRCVATSDALPVQFNLLAAIILIAIMIIADRKHHGEFMWERFPYGKRGW